MRLRFFATILTVLLVSAVAISVVHFGFFRGERLRLVDQQIQSLASSLISNLSVVEFEDIEEADRIIAQTLGVERIRMLIYVRTYRGQLVYANRNAEILGAAPPLKPQWVTVGVRDHVLRILNLPLRREGWILQVGLLLDDEQIHWRNLSYTVFAYVALILIVMLIAAFLLTRMLLKPLRTLAKYLRYLAETPEPALASASESPLFSMPVTRARRGLPDDELGELVAAVRDLNRSLGEKMRIMNARTAQMAHELKTPLTIIRNDIERAVDHASPESKESLRDAQSEIDRLGRLITSFLDWFRLGASKDASQDLHALHLRAVVEEIAIRMERFNEGRVRVEGSADTIVFAKPELLDNVVTNLVQNALQYSAASQPVVLRLELGQLTVEDQGPGIPNDVLAKLGQPFNVGQAEHASATGTSLNTYGSGLGLAWVKAVCDRYDWKLEIETATIGTKVRIAFGEESDAP